MNTVEYKEKLRKIEYDNKQKQMKEQLKNAKYKSEKKKYPTSKKVLFLMLVLCLQIVIVVEIYSFKFADSSALYAVVGIPVALAPVIWKFFSKSQAENTQGGIVFQNMMNEYEFNNHLNNSHEKGNINDDDDDTVG